MTEKYRISGSIGSGTGARSFVFESRSNEWANITRHCVVDNDNNGTVTIQLPDHIITEEKVVPDANKFDWDGTQLIDKPQSEWSVREFNNERTNQDERTGRILMINLESPHKSEYDDEFNPLWPLMGTQAAERLHDKLPELIGLMRLDGSFRIIISNPVPLQASLAYCSTVGGLLEKVRDEAWTTLYYAACRNCFIGRVSRYKPNWVLNACTIGVRGRVSETLGSLATPPNSIWEIDHPSGRHFNNPIMNKIEIERCASEPSAPREIDLLDFYI